MPASANAQDSSLFVRSDFDSSKATLSAGGEEIVHKVTVQNRTVVELDVQLTATSSEPETLSYVVANPWTPTMKLEPRGPNKRGSASATLRTGSLPAGVPEVEAKVTVESSVRCPGGAPETSVTLRSTVAIA